MKNNEKDFNNDEDDGSASGTGGQSGEIKFRYRDILSTEPHDDFLPPSEKKRLLEVHKDIHKSRVDKQKSTRKERKALKEGRPNLNTGNYFNNAGLGTNGARSTYKTHPIAYKFSGMQDTKVSAFPSENNADTNPEKKHELQNRYENKLQLQNTPRFNPKPRLY